MRTPPADRAATDLRRLATHLADGTWARALTIAGDGSPLRSTAGGGGRGAIGAHSDPTANAALGQPDQLPTQTELISAIDAVRVALGARGACSHHWLAGRLQGAAQLIGPGHDDWTLLWRHVDRCLALVDRCIVPAAAAAHEHRKAVARQARYCVACEAPLTPDDRRSMCEPDYWLWRQPEHRRLYTDQPEGDPGSDRWHFVAWVRARIADPTHPHNGGLPLRRPGSPHEPDAAPTVHDDEVA